MKKTFILLTAVSLIFATADAKTKKPKESVAIAPVTVFTNDVDSMSYALGTNVGIGLFKNLKTLPQGKYNLDLFIKGFTTSIKGDSALMKEEFVKQFLNNYFTKANAKDMAAKKAEGEKFLAENKAKEGVITTASGLQYQVLISAEGLKPKATDSVKVHYQGFLLDGTKFDSSVDRGEPVVFPLNQVIPGWTEGVQLMSKGSKYKFFVPYNLAYGEKGAGNGAIPGFATLIFEVELLDIKPLKEIVPVTIPAPEVKAVKTTKSGKGIKQAK
jgi:FKBP-type peptidyl-prolyl cis-trans isomerase